MLTLEHLRHYDAPISFKGRRLQMADGGNFILGGNNTANATTRLERGGIAGNDAVFVQNNNGFGISGIGTRTPTSRGDGVYGFSRTAGDPSGDLTASPGVHGESTNGTGVFGESQTEGYGVHGASFGTGVRGESNADGSGVFGSSADGHGISGISSSRSRAGVRGSSTRRPGAEQAGVGVWGSSPDNAGVAGTSVSSFGVFGRSDNVGVVGRSTSGTIAEGDRGEGVAGVFEPEGLQAEPPLGHGVFGTSTSGFGVFGRADEKESAGVVGVSTEGLGVAGVTLDPPIGRKRGWAGQFDGKVFVRGDATVKGTKSAAVPHPDGSHRQLYALESPESWFEDFGRGEMVRGRAQVELDPDYAAVVQTEDYHVFLTPEGDSRGLYVSNKRSSAFEVREQQEGTSTLTFSYRVIARRADIEVERLEKVELPPPIQRHAEAVRMTSLELPQLDEQLDEEPERPNDSNDTLVE
jgi:hypothetical protein